MKRIIVLCFILFAVPACSLMKKGFTVTGKVARDKVLQADVNVYAYRADSLLDFKKPDTASKTDKEGLFRLNLSEEDDYYITAKTFDETNKPDTFAFYGRNPVFVTKSGIENVNLNLQKIKGGVDFKESEMTEIRCILTHKGEPLSYANVFVALDLNEGMQTKGFAQSDMSDDKGEVLIRVDTGRYYLTARKRLTGMFGPMQEGDLIGFFHENPIVIDKAGTYTVNIELVKIPEKANKDRKVFTKMIITGTIINMDGDPVEGIWVGAYSDPQMFGKPLFISQKSDASGRYELYLPKPGKYYLAARDTLGGPPNPGEMYGSYSGTDDHSISIEPGGKLTGIEITVREMW